MPASYKIIIWSLFIVVTVGSYGLAFWLRTKGALAVVAGFIFMIVVDVIIYFNFPATLTESNIAAIFVIGGTGGYLCAALVEPVRKFAKWLEKIGYDPLG